MIEIVILDKNDVFIREVSIDRQMHASVVKMRCLEKRNVRKTRCLERYLYRQTDAFVRL